MCKYISLFPVLCTEMSKKIFDFRYCGSNVLLNIFGNFRSTHKHIAASLHYYGNFYNSLTVVKTLQIHMCKYYYIANLSLCLLSL